MFECFGTRTHFTIIKVHFAEDNLVFLHSQGNNPKKEFLGSSNWQVDNMRIVSDHA